MRFFKTLVSQIPDVSLATSYQKTRPRKNMFKHTEKPILDFN